MLGMAKRRAAGPTPPALTEELVGSILTEMADGKTLREVCAGFPGLTPPMVRGYIQRRPALLPQFQVAKLMQSHALFERSLEIIETLRTGDWGKEDGPKVQALKAAIDGLRVGAGKLNPTDYGERAPSTPIVPIQIITSLPLNTKVVPLDNDPMLSGTFRIEAPSPAAPEENGNQLLLASGSSAAVGGGPIGE